MRSRFLVGFALGTALLLCCADLAHAQRRGGWGGGRGGWGGGWGRGSGWGISVGVPGFSGYYGSGSPYYGYGGYGYGYGSPWYGGGYGYGYPSYGYVSPGYSYYDYYPSYGMSTYDNSYPNYSYSTSTYQPSTSGVMQAQYSYPSQNPPQNQALLRIELPRADARITLQGVAMDQGFGMERMFISPPLESGKTYTYTVRCTWMDGNNPITREKTIDVQPGQTAMVDFREGGVGGGGGNFDNRTGVNFDNRTNFDNRNFDNRNFDNRNFDNRNFDNRTGVNRDTNTTIPGGTTVPGFDPTRSGNVNPSGVDRSTNPGAPGTGGTNPPSRSGAGAGGTGTGGTGTGTGTGGTGTGGTGTGPGGTGSGSGTNPSGTGTNPNGTGGTGPSRP